MTSNSKIVNQSNQFVRDIMWVGLSQILTSLLSIVTMPALTKTYTTTTYGIWAQVGATVSLIVPILGLQFGTAIVRFLAAEEDKVKRRRSLGAMLSAIVILASLLLLGTIFATQQISLFLFDDPGYPTFVYLTFLWICADVLYTFLIAYLRARGKIKRLSIIQTIFAASKVGLIIALASLDFEMQWIVAAMVGVELLFALGMFFVIVWEEGFPVPNFDGLGGFLAFSVPQIPTGVLLWIIAASDRYFITHYLSLSQTGIYSSSSSLSALISIFYSPICFVLLPTLSKAWEQKRWSDVKNYLEYSTKLFLTIAIPAVCGLTILSQSLLKILATSEYLAGLMLILLMCVSLLFAGLFQINEYIIFLVKQTKWEPLMIIAAAAISIGLNAALIPYVGLIGAAISRIAAYFVLAVIVVIWAKKTINYDINLKYIGKIVLASLVMVLSVYFLKVEGVLGILLTIIIGLVVFVIMLLILRTFNEQDKRIIKRTFAGIMPWLRHKNNY